MNDFLETLKTKRVLIIDPNAVYRSNIRVILSNIGITNVKQASNAKDSLDSIKNNSIDIVLCEYHLNDNYSGQQLLEDLRQNHTLPLKTTFFILTTEKQRNSVISVAEFLPDAYLLKPFTSELLENKLIESLYKKHALSEIYHTFDNKNYIETIKTIRRKKASLPNKFNVEIHKLEGDCLLLTNQLAEAKEFYTNLKSKNNSPWVYYGLSRTLVYLEQYEEAENIILDIMKKNPSYIHLYDFLAEIKLKQNKFEETKEVLQIAYNLSDRNTNRLRKYAEILEEIEKYDEAEQIFSKTTDRSTVSINKNLEDVLNLSRLSVRNKNKNNIKKAINHISSHFKNDNTEIIKHSLESSFHYLNGDEKLAHSFLNRALEKHKQIADENSTEENILIHLVECCSNLNRKEELKEVLTTLATFQHNHNNKKTENHLQNICKNSDINTDSIRKEAELHISGINEKALLLAKNGEIEEAMNLLIKAATQTPNLLFLCNATKSIFTYINLNSWNQDKAFLAMNFLKQALSKGKNDPLVKTTYAYVKRICEKYSISLDSLLTRESQ